ncbi:MAG: hypothetical protein AB8E82_09660 [Aureispira sp.]
MSLYNSSRDNVYLSICTKYLIDMIHCRKIIIKILIGMVGLSLKACQATNLSDQPTTTTLSTKRHSPSTPTTSTKQFHTPPSQGRAEWSAFKKKYQTKWTTPPSVFPYAQGASFKVYPLNCSGECKDAVFFKRTTFGTTIPESDFLELLALLKKPTSYDNATAACFDPKFGLVAYDTEGIPIEFLSICLDCNNIRTYPGKLDVQYHTAQLNGFSKQARQQLRQLFLRWQIDYYGFSQFWDDEDEFLKYLDQKK